VSELRNVAPPGLVEAGFGGRHHQIVVFSFSFVYAAVTMVMRFRVVEPLLKLVIEISGKMMKDISGRIVKDISGKIVKRSLERS
jgi:hypothetical protein